MHLKQSTTDSKVRAVAYEPARHRSLLLLADPEEAVLEGYIRDCLIYEYVENEAVLGVAATLNLPDGSVELKNIAVSAEAQRGGIGSALVRRVRAEAGARRLIVGTADASSEAIAFYERNGFRAFGRIERFFLERYAEPVYDNGRLCRDMVLLEMKNPSES